MQRLPDFMPAARAAMARGYRSPYAERELTRPCDLCDARGRLDPAAVGWSRTPLVRANLRGHWPRKKRWNFWNWIGRDFVLSATLADVDYAAFCAGFFIDLATGDELRFFAPARPGRLGLPEDVERSVAFRSKAVDYENANDGGDLRVRLRAGTKGGPLSADLLVHRPEGHESLNVVVPWSERRFQLNSKHNALPCEGRIVAAGREVEVDPRSTWAVQDFGRGLWPWRSFWNWGVSVGVCDGHTVGVNMGAKWTTGTGSNENGILVDGRLHKVMQDLEWRYDPDDDRAPWRVRTVHGDAIDLALAPRHAHRQRLSLGLLASGGVCVFGRWSGTVRVGGQAFAIRDHVGWAEEFAHRW